MPPPAAGVGRGASAPLSSPPTSGGGGGGGASGYLHMPLKQKMAFGLKSLLGSAKKLTIGDSPSHASISDLFPKVDPAVDGEDCDRDCDSCVVKYPRSFKVDEDDVLYGFVKGWSTHVLVATGKSDWVRDVKDEKGSLMQAIGKEKGPSNGRLMLSASNIPTPHQTSDYSEPTTVLLLPAFILVENVTPATVPTLITELVDKGPTNISPLSPVSLPPSLPAPLPEATPASLTELTTRPSPHAALVLLCSQRTRDARCGQSAPLLRKELERHLRPLGLQRDLDDERPGGVGIYFISHVGGHKYSANVIVYRRRDAFGLDSVERGRLREGETAAPRKAGAAADGGETTKTKSKSKTETEGESENKDGNSGEETEVAEEEGEDGDVGAAQCIWLARVRPEDCEGLVKFTVLQGKVIKPERQLRGGFDRSKGLMSW